MRFLVLLLIFVIMGWSFYGCGKRVEKETASSVKGPVRGMEAQKSKTTAQKEVVSSVKDPVCGMEAQKSKTTPQSTYKGKTYYFCSLEDKQKFDKNPQKYIK